jgi:hypothetical protein
MRARSPYDFLSGPTAANKESGKRMLGECGFYLGSEVKVENEDNNENLIRVDRFRRESKRSVCHPLCLLRPWESHVMHNADTCRMDYPPISIFI